MLRRVWLALGWLWIALVFYLSLRQQYVEPVLFEGVDKLHHALAYAPLMLWVCQGVTENWPRFVLLMALVLMGLCIEILQGKTGHRLFAWADVWSNLTGAVIGLGLAQTRLGRVLKMLEENGKH